MKKKVTVLCRRHIPCRLFDQHDPNIFQLPRVSNVFLNLFHQRRSGDVIIATSESLDPPSVRIQSPLTNTYANELRLQFHRLLLCFVAYVESCMYHMITEFDISFSTPPNSQPRVSF